MPPRRPHRAMLALLVMTLIWGWTFTWMRQSLDAAAPLGAAARTAVVAWMIALRFGLAAVVLALALPSSRRGLGRTVRRGGGVLGAVLLAGFVLQMLGLAEVAPGVSAFLTSLYVVFTAILTALRGTHRVTLPLVGGVLLATLGAGFIEGPPHLTFGLPEWLTVACAFIFAIHILLTDEITRRVAPLPVTLVSFVVVAVGAGILLPFALAVPGAPAMGDLVALVAVPSFTIPLVLASVLATVGALTIMNVFQREVDPVRAAIVYALEPVWASIIAVASGYGQAGPWLWIGGAALLAGNVVAEIGARPSPRESTTREPGL